MQTSFNASAIALIQDYLEEGSSLKLKILSQIIGEFFDNNNQFPKEFHITIPPHEDSGLIRDSSRKVLKDLWFYLKLQEPQYEFSRTEAEENFATVIFKRT